MAATPTAVAQYLKALPAESRRALEKLRAVVVKNIDPKYQEGTAYGMIGWSVPHSVYPAGYHCDPKMPLPFCGMAARKGYFTFHAMSVYGSDPELKWLKREFAKAGKKLDMGKACIRFKRVEDVPFEVIGALVKRHPTAKFIAYYEKAIAARPNQRKALEKAKAAAAARAEKKPAPKRAAKKAAPKRARKS